MKKTFLISTLTTLLATILFAQGNAATETNLAPEQADAKYTVAISERSQKIVDALELTDTNTAAKVHDIIMAQYRALNNWHNANDPKIKAAKRDQAVITEIQVPLKKMHDDYLARLATYLTPAQIETIKDKMTYGKVQFTFTGYCNEYPDLTEVNKQEVLKYLKEAREAAMDAGSSDEKSAIFNQYKGKINNYLSKQGIQSKKSKSQAK
jgi:Protein of unknown function (DUF3826)